MTDHSNWESNVNTYCGAYHSLEEVMMSHEVLCECTCVPTGVVEKEEATPMVGVMVLSNMAVHVRGEKPACVGDNTAASETEYYLNTALR